MTTRRNPWVDTRIQRLEAENARLRNLLSDARRGEAKLRELLWKANRARAENGMLANSYRFCWAFERDYVAALLMQSPHRTH